MRSNLHRDARREAFYRCGETCAEVGSGIEKAIERLLNGYPIIDEELKTRLTDTSLDMARQYGTEPLRAALIEAETERLVAQDELADARAEVDRLKDELDEARTIIRELEDQIANALV